MFPDNAVCSTYSRQIFPAKKEFCVLYKVNQLQSGCAQYWKVLIPKNRVTNDRFLACLYEYSGQNTNSDDTDVSNDIYYSAVTGSTSPD